MQTNPNLLPSDMLRLAMRHWTSGVAIATSRMGDVAHGMTVNSFVSVSIDPPLVTVTMNHDTRTCALVRESGIFAVSILSARQQTLAERFAGRLLEDVDRMAGVDVFTLVTGAPLMTGGLAFIDCQVVHQHPMPRSTLFIGEVLVAQSVVFEENPPLVYHNRAFSRLA